MATLPTVHVAPLEGATSGRVGPPLERGDLTRLPLGPPATTAGAAGREPRRACPAVTTCGQPGAAHAPTGGRRRTPMRLREAGGVPSAR